MLPISCNDNVQEKDEFHPTGADLKSVAVFRIRYWSNRANSIVNND